MGRLLRRRWFWSVLLLAVGLLTSSIWLILKSQGPATLANFDRIQLGMTEHEVRHILGDETIPIFTKGGEFGAIWCNGDFFPYYSDHIELWFGKDWKVINKTFTRAPMWNKVQGLFLPRERTSPKLLKFRSHDIQIQYLN